MVRLDVLQRAMVIRFMDCASTNPVIQSSVLPGGPVHALATFQRSGLDALYLGCHRIQKESNGK